MMICRSPYKLSLVLLVLSWLSFMVLMYYHTDSQGHTWILYHEEHWIVSVYLAVFALASFLAGVARDLTDKKVPHGHIVVFSS